MNMALDGETPYDNANLFGFLMRHMSVMKTLTQITWYTDTEISGSSLGGSGNAAFYTTDGMRFEFPFLGKAGTSSHNKLHESDVYACLALNPFLYGNYDLRCNGCGSFGLEHNPHNTTKPPCLILVDVNGDKKPTPGNVDCKTWECGGSGTTNSYKVPLPGEKKVRDIFSILITEDRAIPYGVTAQKAMYQAQK